MGDAVVNHVVQPDLISDQGGNPQELQILVLKDLEAMFESNRVLFTGNPTSPIRGSCTSEIITIRSPESSKKVNFHPSVRNSKSVEEDDDVFCVELEETEDEPDRAAWGGKMQFIFTCIGYAVGLGNVWRFPYLCYKNGGGAFLLPYVIMLGLVGLPLFYMELAFGQFASLGPITIWRINPLMKGLGYAMVAVSWLIAVYYNVIISHVMLYLFASFAAIPTGLPWTSCDNWWNTPHCIAPNYGFPNSTNASDTENSTVDFASTVTESVAMVTKAINNSTVLERTPAEEYYNYYVLEMSDSIDDMGKINWKLALCLLLAWLIVLVCLIRGIQSLGKVVYFTAIFPYVMLTVLFVRGVTLPGSYDGIIFYLKPNFERLADPRVWSDAATQIFYSLSACSGGLIAMASYNKFDNNCYKDALIVSMINCGTSLYAGFVIFSILGFIANEKGVDVDKVVEEGPGLAFVVYPEAISQMPAPQLWAIFFFFMMATLGFGSQFSIVECVLSALSDEFAPYLKKKWQSILFRTVIIMATFLLGLPMVTKGGIYLLTLVDYSVSGFPLLIVGLFELISINWIYGYGRFADNIDLMLGHKPERFWMICWKFVSPLMIVVTIFFNCLFYKEPDLGHYLYPDWAQTLGWCIALWPILMIPGYFIVKFCVLGGYKSMVQLMKPSTEWGPTHTEDKKRYYAALASRPLTPDPSTHHKTFSFSSGNTVELQTVKTQRSVDEANEAWDLPSNTQCPAVDDNVHKTEKADTDAGQDQSSDPLLKKTNKKALRININDSNLSRSQNV